MTKHEHERRTHLTAALRALGFTDDETAALRRISGTLHRWHELECGTGTAHADYAVERSPDGIPYMVTHLHGQGVSKTYRRRVPDRETGARKRLAKILRSANERRFDALPNGESMQMLDAYVQTDPRGAALYILRPGDIPEGYTPDSCYTRGICVY